MTIRDVPRLGLALVFLAAAPQKIMDPVAFATSIESYLFVPDFFVQPIALFLPWLEALLVIMLLTRFWLGPALVVSNVLLIIFLGALVSAQIRGINLDCGCFSTTGQTTDKITWYILRDLIFLALGLGAAWLEFGHLCGKNKAEVLVELVEDDSFTAASTLENTD